MNILDNEAFSQVLSSELDLDFEARRKRGYNGIYRFRKTS